MQGIAYAGESGALRSWQQDYRAHAPKCPKGWMLPPNVCSMWQPEDRRRQYSQFPPLYGHEEEQLLQAVRKLGRAWLPQWPAAECLRHAGGRRKQPSAFGARSALSD